MELTLLSSPNDDMIRVRSCGPVSTSAAHDPLKHLIGEPGYTRTVLLFLDESRGIDTSGVCWLVNSNKRFTESGGKLVLVAVPPGVHDTLEFLHLIPLLNIVPNEQAAYH